MAGIKSNKNSGSGLSDEKAAEEGLKTIEEKIRKNQEILIDIQRETGEKYQESQKLADELKTKTEKLQQCEQQQADIERHVKDLTQQRSLLSKELEKLGETVENNRKLQRLVLQAHEEIDKKKKEVEELSAKIRKSQENDKSKQAKIEELESRLKTIRESYDDYKKKAETATAKLKEQLQAQRQMVTNNEAVINTMKTNNQKLHEHKQQLLDINQQLNAAKLQTESDLESEKSRHKETNANLMQQVETVMRMTSQLQSKEQEMLILQDEVNKARIEARELTIRFNELPEKEAQFKRIDAKNDQLREENAELQEQIKETNRLQSLVSFLRDQNESYWTEKEKLKERSKTIEEKYKDLMQQYVTQSTEIQTYMSDRTKLKKKLAEKNSESGVLQRLIQQLTDKVNNLEKDLANSQTELMNTKSQLYSFSALNNNNALSGSQEDISHGNFLIGIQ